MSFMARTFKIARAKTGELYRDRHRDTEVKGSREINKYQEKKITGCKLSWIYYIIALCLYLLSAIRNQNTSDASFLQTDVCLSTHEFFSNLNVIK